IRDHNRAIVMGPRSGCLKLLLAPVLTQGAHCRQLRRVEAQLGEVVWRERLHAAASGRGRTG
ncbi:MAG: hypothetical protein RKP46_03760, partial [Candidatus Accumulibacter sp.]|uniref:hypothetical protein n=1 Tax=Accumulibacter sp. TaxID=2053492 RepID=UPI002879EABF